MALASPPGNDRKRVKVYELKNNDWFDRGTGFCTGSHTDGEARLHVQSEDEPTRTLLETRITKNEGYQKQQDTLIVWTEQNGTDMALSFQEAEGCGQIWEFVHGEQQRLNMMGPDDGLSDVAEAAHPMTLPTPSLGNLTDIEQMMRNANTTVNGREALSKFVANSFYISKLIILVQEAEDLESLQDLHRLCNIMKLLILLNDTAIIEQAVSDENVLGVVGALEYDPDFPCHKANHRQYLSDESRFKEVVKIEDLEIKKKIHHTYRLQYLKDVVLARILDDPTFSVLNSMIYFNQVEIVSHLQTNGTFLKDLFNIFATSESTQSQKRDATLFIQQCCSVAKSLQNQTRNQLFTNFLSGGLFNVITYALRHEDAAVRVAGTDILIALIDHDPLMMRSQIFKAINEKSKPLTDTLIELLLVESDLGVKSQMADAIKVLLDPTANHHSLEQINRASGPEHIVRMRQAMPTPPESEAYVQNFYDESTRKLFRPLQDLEHRPSMSDMTIPEIYLYGHLLDVLIFFVHSYHARSKFIILSEDLPSRIALLLSCPEKHLRLTALRFLRKCLWVQDATYEQHLIDKQLFDPIINLLFETLPRDSLLNSACIEIFEHLKRDNRHNSIKYVVEKYRDKLSEVTQIDTFKGLIDYYEMKSQEDTQDASFTSRESITFTPDHRSIVNGGGRWQGLKDADPEEESYFNSSDGDEDDIDPLATLNKSVTNGASPIRPLVNYPDDDDDDDMDILAMDPSERDKENGPVPSTESENRSESTIPTVPPERLAEKRRRGDDDDEDELGKLSQTKRRSSSFSSTTSATSNNGNGTALLRRKKSLTPSKDGAPKKMAISLAVKSSGDGSENSED